MDRPPARSPRWPIARYAMGWLVAGAVVATVMIATLHGIGSDRLPPLRRTELSAALAASGCRLVHAVARRPGNPPAAGPAPGPPARGGVYEHAPATPGLLAAVRHGMIVVHYRGRLPGGELDDLRNVQRAVPTGTIVTPNATGMPYEVAVVAWRRILGCRHFNGATLDAIRLFRARNLGRGPDSRP